MCCSSPLAQTIHSTGLADAHPGKRRRKEEEDRESIDPRCIPTETRWSTGTDMYADNVGGAGIVICSTYLAQIGMELYLMIKCKQQRSFRVKTLPRYV